MERGSWQYRTCRTGLFCLASSGIIPSSVANSKCGDSLMALAAASGDKATFESVLNTVQEKLSPEQVAKQFTSSGKVLQTAIGNKSASFCHILVKTVAKYAYDSKVAKTLDELFPVWLERYEKNYAVKESEDVFFDLLHHSAYPTPDFLLQRTEGTKEEWERFAELVLLAVQSGKNPLSPGMMLSIALAEAAKRAREGSERMLSDLRQKIDDFIKEVLERLPQTVRGFDKGMQMCSGLFEPEGSREHPIARPGPLRIAFSRRQHMENLCAVPLVMDYLSNKFTCGLPDLGDTNGILRNEGELLMLAHSDDDPTSRTLCIGDPESDYLWRLFQGVPVEDIPAFAVLPGAQFVIAGLLTKPRSYYRVTVMRMAMDFVAYLAMLAAYYNLVLQHEDGPVAVGEVLFACYVLTGVYGELEELRRDYHMYLQDQWNYLDILGFIMILGGFFVRLADSKSPWGRGMYALSAPPIFSRILFFAQMLQFQGPMIQAMFSMAVVLLKFGVILVVVMMGFAASFHALYREDSFNETLLNLFMTMLGDVAFFDELEDSSREQYVAVGRLLLAFFIIVVTIMLINLLIAILSTAHAEIHNNMKREFKLSTPRIIQHYRRVVELDTLPAPFNVLQSIMILPFTVTGWQGNNSSRRVKRALGQVVFWLTIGPLAVLTGVILWVASFLRLILFLDKFQRETPIERLGLCIILVLVLFAPVILIVMWLKEPFMWIMRVFEALSKGSTPPVDQEILDVDVQEMLKKNGVNASELRVYLENPMVDPRVQRDEVNRATTVEHVKLLRDHLKDNATALSASTGNIISKLRDEISEKFAVIERRDSDFRDEINEKFAINEGRASTLRDETNANFTTIIEMLEVSRNSTLPKEGEATGGN